MADVENQKKACVKLIMFRLSKTYISTSAVNQTVGKALLKKLSLKELHALYAMVVSSTDIG